MWPYFGFLSKMWSIVLFVLYSNCPPEFRWLSVEFFPYRFVGNPIAEGTCTHPLAWQQQRVHSTLSTNFHTPFNIWQRKSKDFTQYERKFKSKMKSYFVNTHEIFYGIQDGAVFLLQALKILQRLWADTFDCIKITMVPFILLSSQSSERTI